MKIKNELKLTIGSNSSESFIKNIVNSIIPSFISELNPTKEDINDIKTSINEAVNNCIKHAYPGNFVGKIFVTVSFNNKNEIKITVRDNGIGIKDIEQAMLPFNTVDFNKYSGLGFSVMQAFVDEVKVKSVPDCGTTVILIKKINISKKGA